MDIIRKLSHLDFSPLIAVIQHYSTVTAHPLALSCAGLMLLLYGVVSPTPVRASCGDYVVVGSGRLAPMSGHAVATSQVLFADHQLNLPLLPVCRGASCGHRHGLPTSPTPMPTNSGSEQWGCLLVDRNGPGMARTFATWDVPLHLLAGHPATIDRPPRSPRG